MRKILRTLMALMALLGTSSAACAQGMDHFVNGPTFVTEGGGYTAMIAAASTSPTVLRIGPGRLARTLITAVGTTGNVTLYDNPSACSGAILAVVPGASNASTVGQLGYVADDEVRFLNGLTVCGSTGSPAITLSWW